MSETTSPNTPAMRSPGVLRSAARIYGALWHYGRGMRASLVLAMILIGGAELSRLALPWLAGQGINALQHQGLAGMGTAGQCVAALLAIVLASWSCHAAGRLLERNVALRARAALSLHLLERLVKAPLSWFQREPPVAVAQRAIQSTEALHQFGETQYKYLQSIIRIAGPLIALWLISPALGVTATVGLALLSAISLGFDRVLLRLGLQRNEADRRNSATWAQVLTGMLTVRALRLQQGVLRLLENKLEAVYRPLRKSVVVNEVKWGAVDVLGPVLWCSLVVVYVLEAAAAGATQIALGGVFMVYEYGRRAEQTMITLAGDFSMLASQLSGFQAAQPIVEAPQREAEPLRPTRWKTMTLEAVSMDHPGGGPALQNLNLRLHRGRRYALVGASGAGKSTLMLLLAGLQESWRGAIRLDGVVAGVRELRAEAALVPAERSFLDDTLIGNVSPGELHRRGEIQEALKAAGLGTLLHRLEEDVSQLSSGQQQRLLQARGLLHATGASLVLLDEPTTHLDAESGHALLRTTLAAHAGACVVCAIHDPALLTYFDEVIVMEAGRVVSGAEYEAPVHSALEAEGQLTAA